jgi:hypothetical protein
MSISRRDFFKISALPVFASIALSREGMGQTPRLNTDSSPVHDDRLMTLRAADFRNQIGSRFKFSVDNVVRAGVLIEVKNFETPNANQSLANTSSNSEDSKCFSLSFKLVGLSALKQATYKVTHDILGDFQLFLAPGALKARQPLLIAVINRSF